MQSSIGGFLAVASAVAAIVGMFVFDVWQYYSRFDLFVAALAAAIIALGIFEIVGRRGRPTDQALLALVGVQFGWTSVYLVEVLPDHRAGRFVLFAGVALLSLGAIIVRILEEMHAETRLAAQPPVISASAFAAPAAGRPAGPAPRPAGVLSEPAPEPELPALAPARPAAERQRVSAAATLAPSAPPVAQLPRAGWYNDPAESGGLRYWTGTKWSDAVGSV